MTGLKPGSGGTGISPGAQGSGVSGGGGSAPIAFVASAVDAGGPPTDTGSSQFQRQVTLPGSVAAGHLAFLFIGMGERFIATGTNVQGSTGWVQLDNYLASAQTACQVLWKVLDATDISNGAITYRNNVAFVGFGLHCMFFSGANTAVKSASTTASDVSALAVTPSTAGTMVVQTASNFAVGTLNVQIDAALTRTPDRPGDVTYRPVMTAGYASNSGAITTVTGGPVGGAAWGCHGAYVLSKPT